MLIELFTVAHADSVVKQHQSELRQQVAQENLVRALRHEPQSQPKPAPRRAPLLVTLRELVLGVR